MTEKADFESSGYFKHLLPASQPLLLIHHFTDEELKRAVSIAVTMMNEATTYTFLKQYIEPVYCQHL